MRYALQNLIRCIYVFLCLSYFINSTLRDWNSMKTKKTNFKAINWAPRPGSYKTHTPSLAHFAGNATIECSASSVVCQAVHPERSRAGGNRMGKRMGEWDGDSLRLLYTTGRFRKLNSVHREQDMSVYKMIYKRVNHSPRGTCNLKSKDLLTNNRAITAIIFVTRFTLAFPSLCTCQEYKTRITLFKKIKGILWKCIYPIGQTTVRQEELP